MFTRRTALAALAALGIGGKSRAQPGGPVLKLGVLNDQSGPYRDNGGAVSVACARQAVKEFAAANGLDVEVVVADHQGKVDVALGIARQWFDRDAVDVAMDFQNSTIALAVAGLAREKDKVALVCNAGTSELTGKQCTPNTLHWAYDSYMMARTIGGALTAAGGNAWFFITADYAFGRALESDTSAFVRQAGGTVAGHISVPFPTADFSAALVQAQASRANVISFANGGSDTINCIKQAAEFGVAAGGTKLAALLLQINDVHALGLATAHGLSLAETFYWDMNDRTRAFAARVAPSTGGVMPNASQAACYAAALHYMKAAATMGAQDAKRSGAAVVARMKATPVDDDVAGSYTIRQDGRVMNPAYLFEVKQPSESTKPWDYYKLVATVPAQDAFRPLATSGCPLIKGAEMVR